MAIENLPKNLEEFNQLISKNKYVVVDFHATWCGPCKVIAPKFEILAGEFDTVAFAKVDVDDVPDVAGFVGVRAMPTFIFFKNGEKFGEVVGANVKNIEAKLQELVASA